MDLWQKTQDLRKKYISFFEHTIWEEHITFSSDYVLWLESEIIKLSKNNIDIK